MSKPQTKILAIDPGTRRMGVALFDRGRLIYHGVKVVKGKKSSHRKVAAARRIVLRLIKDFGPRIVAVEKAFFARSKNVSGLHVLVEEIKDIAKRKRLRLMSFAPSTVKKKICGNGHASKREVAKAVVAEYPELKVYLTQDRAWKEKFHQNMFDAVALGIIARKHEKIKSNN